VVRCHRSQFRGIQVLHNVVLAGFLILVANYSDHYHGFVMEQVSRIDICGLSYYQSKRETAVSDSNVQIVAPHPFLFPRRRIVRLLRLRHYRAHEIHFQAPGQLAEVGVTRHPDLEIQTASHTNPGKTCHSCHAHFRCCLLPSTRPNSTAKSTFPQTSDIIRFKEERTDDM
jgi:hypothetical protein